MEEAIPGFPVNTMPKQPLMVNPETSPESLLTKIKNRPFHYFIIFLCLINISLVAVNIGLWIIAAYQKLFVAADFTSFYTGYYLVRVGEGANLYDRAIQSIYQQQFMGGLTFQGGVLLFPNPPFVAIALSPFSFLPLEVAFYLWTLIQVGLLIWTLSGLNRLFSDWDKRERIILDITILAFWPLAYTFLLGQFSLLLLIGLMQMYIAIKASKLTSAGLWMFLLAIKPHTLIIPGMLTINKRYWRVAITTILTGLSIFVISILIIGVQPWLEYIQSLLALSSYFGEYGVHPITEYTIRGVLSNILVNSQGNLVNSLSIIILFIGMISIWLLWKDGESQDKSRFILYFAFTILLSVFLSLHLNPHDSLILILPAALFYDYLRKNNFPRKAYAVILLLSPTIFIIAAFNKFNLFGVIRPPVLVILTMLVWMAYYLIKDCRQKGVTSL